MLCNCRALITKLCPSRLLSYYYFYPRMFYRGQDGGEGGRRWRVQTRREPSPGGGGRTLDPPGGMSSFPASGNSTCWVFFFFSFINLFLVGFITFSVIPQVANKLASREWESHRAGPWNFMFNRLFTWPAGDRGTRMCPRFQSHSWMWLWSTCLHTPRVCAGIFPSQVMVQAVGPVGGE